MPRLAVYYGLAGHILIFAGGSTSISQEFTIACRTVKHFMNNFDDNLCCDNMTSPSTTSSLISQLFLLLYFSLTTSPLTSQNFLSFHNIFLRSRHLIITPLSGGGAKGGRLPVFFEPWRHHSAHRTRHLLRYVRIAI